MDYWASGQGLGNITPAGKPWPEGEGFPGVLREIVGQGRVLEFGCGVGRLAMVFQADRYIGIDICDEAIRRARTAIPSHDFRLAGPSLPDADVTLAHTVLLHVPDQQLASVIRRFRTARVVVSEILGRHWRRQGDPPVFNREQIDYEAAFAAFGYQLDASREIAYPHYRDTDLTLLTFAK